MSNVAKNCNILAAIVVWTFYIILIDQQNYFADLYPAKILGLLFQNRYFCCCRDVVL